MVNGRDLEVEENGPKLKGGLDVVGNGEKLEEALLDEDVESGVVVLLDVEGEGDVVLMVLDVEEEGVEIFLGGQMVPLMMN